MCGIAGFIVNDPSRAQLIFDILENQKHRGMTSCGIAWVNDGKIEIHKDVVAPSKYKEEWKGKLSLGKIGIAHNRAPSVGEAAVHNAHPFLSCNKRFALVHNGTVSKKLYSPGMRLFHDFEGDTDSEYMLHVFEEFYNILSEDAEVRERVSKLFESRFKNKTDELPLLALYLLHLMLYNEKGYNSYAVLVLSADGKIYGIRKGNPVVIAIEKDSVFIASEVRSFDGVIKSKADIYTLDEGSMFIASKDGVTIFGEHSKKEYESEEEKETIISQSFVCNDCVFKVGRVCLLGSILKCLFYIPWREIYEAFNFRDTKGNNRGKK